MRAKSGLYEYLEKAGVLANGSKEAIEQAKKKYWSLVRKEWQKAKRKESKGYTIFLSPAEHTEVLRAMKHGTASVTSFIKQSALHAARNSHSVDRVMVGKIREAFFEAYNAIEGKGQAMHSAPLLSELALLEKKILALLQ